MAYATNPDIDLEIKKLLLILKRRWKLGVAIFIFSIALSTVAAIRKKPQYEAVAKLLFQNSQTSSLTGIGENSNNLESLERDANPIVSEIEVIKSVPIAQKTIADLELTDRTGKALKPAKLINRLDVISLSGSDVVAVSYRSQDPVLAVKIVDRLMYNYIQNSSLISNENVTTANKIIEQQLPKARTKVIEKEKALQQFQEKHQIFLADDEAQANVGNIRNLEKQIQEVSNQLQEVQINSQELEAQVGMSSEEALAWNKLSHSPAIQKNLEDLQAIHSQLIKERDRYYDTHPVIISLKNQITALETSLQQYITEIGTSSQFSLANILTLDRENLPQELTAALAESEIEAKRLTKKLDNLKNIQRTSQQKFTQMPQLASEFRDLQLQLATAQSKYKLLLEKSQEINLHEQQNFDNVRAIEPAQLKNSNPYFGSFLIIGFGCFLGAVSSISTMATVDIADRKIKSAAEIKNILKYKVLATVPNLSNALKTNLTPEIYRPSRSDYSLPFQRETNKSQLAIKNSEITKAILAQKNLTIPLNNSVFWKLQAKTNFINQNNLGKVITVSSFLPEEGKTTIAANLALTLAQMGQKILIIDGNLHQPMQTNIWSNANSIGLSEVILEGRSVDSAITPITNNLDLLPSGHICSNSLEVTESTEMKYLLQDLVLRYQLILIDSPSLQEIIDTLNLASIADGTILVTRIGRLDYQSANKCRELLDIAEVNVIGMIINEAEQ